MTGNEGRDTQVVELSTDDVRPSERVDFWRGMICEHFGFVDHVGTEHHSTPFNATLRSVQLGDILLSRIAASAHEVGRSQRTFAYGPPARFNFEIPIRGTAFFKQAGREVVVIPGEFAAFNNDRIYWHGFRSRFDKLVVQVPRAMVLSIEPHFDELIAVRAGTDLPFATMVADLFPRLAEFTDWCERPFAARFASALIEPMVIAVSEVRNSLSIPSRSRYLADAKTYLMQHLYDSDLKPEAAASAAGISLRYLYALFQQDGTSVAHWVTERRLGQAHHLLCDPACQRWTITEIAHAVGFRDSSHFSRAFKVAYGCTPRSLRRTLPSASLRSLPDPNSANSTTAARLRSPTGIPSDH